MFCGKRLKIAREFRGWTQTKLGEQVAASCALISLCETGKKKHPARDLVEAFGSVLGFAPQFFDGDLKDVFHEEECNFRHRRTTPERMKAQVRAHGTLIGLVAQNFRGVRFPPLNLPLITASTFEEIETAAEQCREHWKLGTDTPLLQIGEVLEDAGVVIARHVVKSKKVDTFSHYGGGMTIILPNQEIQSGPRWNFDMAHELGHLVMHRRILTGTVETERAANRFAGAFLIPRRAFEREFQAESFSWRHVYKLKIRWQMRAAAIVRRAYDLRLLGAVEYRKAVKYMSVKGWTKTEPYERALHYSERFENAVNYLAQRGSLPTFCEKLRFTPDTFYEVTGIAITPRNIAPVVAQREPPKQIPKPAPTPEELGVLGLDSIPPGAEVVWVTSSDNVAKLAPNWAHPIVVMKEWHSALRDHSVFRDVKVLWHIQPEQSNALHDPEKEASRHLQASLEADPKIKSRLRWANANAVPAEAFQKTATPPPGLSPR